jgi:hypothetical protein
MTFLLSSSASKFEDESVFAALAMAWTARACVLVQGLADNSTIKNNSSDYIFYIISFEKIHISTQKNHKNNKKSIIKQSNYDLKKLFV